ncbi:hypothetical protein V2J09_021260 [Rumex salicifolius]
MDPPAPEFDDHQWGLPPQPIQNRDYPPLPHGGGLNAGETQRHSQLHHNRQSRRHEYHHGDDTGGADDELYHHYNGPPDECFGANGELGHTRPHHLQRKRRASNYDRPDGGNYLKLFVGGVPNTVTEEDVRLLFEEYGSVVEVVLCWDKWTGHQKEYAFVKYASFEEADNAIKVLHDQYIWPGTIVPLRVKYADGERERLGAGKQKVYVNNINKQASKEEIAELFSHYGAVEDIYLMLDEFKQNRGCGFVGFSHRDMASAAIEGLNGSYVMRGCDRPLVVRFADPKKPRQGELRPGLNCGNTETSPAASHMDNQCPSAENVANVRGGTPVTIQSHQLVLHYQRIQPQSSRSATKPQLPGMTSAKKNAILSPSQFAYDGAPVTVVGEGIPNCDWSEHVCPDGHKYYYNCMTFESRWEKPQELAFHEQNFQTLSGQQLPCISHALTVQFN